MHDASVDLLVDGLVDLGLVPGDADQVHAMHLYREFFMHGTSHWLGLDVHDAGSYRLDGAYRPLEAGMVFTVEPGIYIGPDRPEVEFTLLEHDLDACRAVAHQMDAEIPDSTTVDLAGATHFMFIEEPEQVNAAILDFLVAASSR